MPSRSMHGAGTARDGGFEGTFSENARTVGTVPVVLSRTYTAHDEAMLPPRKACLGHEYPHSTLRDGVQNRTALRSSTARADTQILIKLPVAVPPATTFEGPGKVVNDRCYEWMKEPGVLDCSFTHGFPHTDVSVICTSVLVITDNDEALAKRVAEDVAELILATLDDFLSPLPGAEDAVNQALAATAQPVIVAEVSDNRVLRAGISGTPSARPAGRQRPKTCWFVLDPETQACAWERRDDDQGKDRRVHR